MQFANPYFLFGLLALAIPVIIHLFNFRKFRRVYFSNVRFIKDIQIQTQKQSKLKHWIVLALRILAVTALVMAFAQPFIPMTQKKVNPAAGSAVSIYIDNSFSMEAQSGNGRLVDEARQRAREIVSVYKSSDVFQLLTNDFEGLHQHLVNRDEFLELLENVEITPVVRTLSEVQRRQLDLLSGSVSRNKALYMISDFQKSTSDVGKFATDTSAEIFLVPIKANSTPNIAIDSCWFESPLHHAGQNVKLYARMRNFSGQDYEKVPLKLLINGNQKAVGSFNLPANAETQIVLTYNDIMPGIQSGVLEILDSPVTFDDRFFFSYTVSDALPLLSIDDGQPNIYLNSLYGKDSAFVYTTTTDRAVDYSSFTTYSLIILDGLPAISTGLAQEIRKFLDEGGSILVIPPASADSLSYDAFFNSLSVAAFGRFMKVQQKVATINLEHPVFQDVFDYIPENIDLPAVFGYYRLLTSSQTDMEALLKMQNGDALLGVQSAGNGTVYLLVSPLDEQYTSLPQHAIFVPAFYRIALLSRQQGALFHTLGQNERIDLRNTPDRGDNVIKVRQLNGPMEFIPEQIRSGGGAGIFVHDQVKEAGNYFLTNGKDDLAGLSFNYDRAESDLAAGSPSELKEMAAIGGLKNITVLESKGKNLGTVIEELNLGIRLWKVFIILALIFLAAEIALLRFWK